MAEFDVRPILEATAANLQVPVGHLVDLPWEACADREGGAANFGRWLSATGSPSTYLDFLKDDVDASRALLTVFGASQSLSDDLIQNPELASTVIEANQLDWARFSKSWREEAASLIQTASGERHLFDRIRFLKQKATLDVATRDLMGTSAPVAIWAHLAEIADSLVQQTALKLWDSYAREKGLAKDIPLIVVGFGKLGGRELNYSSDIDLVYLCVDGLTSHVREQLERFCLLLNRALTEQMGRGALYRVDLRLRPFGGSGPILTPWNVWESYYEKYAEPWECMALLRARVLLGEGEWEQSLLELRRRMCYRPSWSEGEIDSIVSMRGRIDEGASGGDFKRGAGGIRDIEFFVQLNQLLNGRAYQELRTESTLDGLEALRLAKMIDDDQYILLAESYMFLRQLEHRCQLLGDVQTHSLPEDDHQKEVIANLLGFAGGGELTARLDHVRQAISARYQKFVASGIGSSVIDSDQRLTSSLRQKLDEIPPEFKASLAASPSSLDRLVELEVEAPVVLDEVFDHLELLEQVLSGEIEENLVDSSFLGLDPLRARRRKVAMSARYGLRLEPQPASNLMKIADSVVRECISGSGVEGLMALALGSYGRGDFGFASDCDLLIAFVDDDAAKSADEVALVRLQAQFQKYGSQGEFGWHFDFRLRPWGSQGSFAPSPQAIVHYAKTAMDLWERFALIWRRPVVGVVPVQLEKLWDGQAINRAELQELLAMKARIENERVPSGQEWNEVKVGWGGLSDVEWLCGLAIMAKRIEKTSSGNGLAGEIAALSAQHFLTEDEASTLQANYQFALDMRNRIWAHDGAVDSSSYLTEWRSLAKQTRKIYESGLSRLEAGL